MTRVDELGIDELRRLVGEYESAITWDTTCPGCSRILDSSYEDFARREQAEERLLRITGIWSSHSWGEDDPLAVRDAIYATLTGPLE